jgi:hypothetical protein
MSFTPQSAFSSRATLPPRKESTSLKGT